MSNSCKSRGWLPIAALAAIGTIFCLPASAQSDEDEGEAAEDDPMVEEIVVTATYRDTDLMDTPLTISALTDVEIEQRGIEDISNLYLSIPGLNYGMATQTYHRVSARGIDNLSFGMSPSVSTYVDNLPISGFNEYRQPLAPVFDLERIEVLKGPQGTLYGEGSMAGAIRYITKGPSPEGFDYAVTARAYSPQYSNDIGHRIDGMVNIPLGEQLAARITGYSRYKAGIMDQVSESEIGEDVNFVDEIGGRFQLAFFPTDSLEISGFAHLVSTDIGGPGIAHHCYVDQRPDNGSLPNDVGGRGPENPRWTPLRGGCESGPNGTWDGKTAKYNEGGGAVYDTHLSAPAFVGVDGGASESSIFHVSLEWEGPWADLIMSSSFYDTEIAYAEEQRGGFSLLTTGRFFQSWDAACAQVEGCQRGVDAYDKDGPIDARSSASGGWSYTERSAHEARLISNNDASRWQWTVGAYVTDTEVGPLEKNWGPCGATGPWALTTYTAPDITCVSARYAFDPRVPVPVQQDVVRILLTTLDRPGGAIYETRSEDAIFGEVSYRISERWEILAGLRWADTGASVHAGPGGRYTTLEEASQNSKVDTKDAEELDTGAYAPKLSLNWRPTDGVLIYGMVASGFRASGVNRWVAGTAEIYRQAVARGVPGAQERLDDVTQRLTFRGDQIRTYELGLKASIGEIDFTAAAYRMNMTDAVIHDTDVIPGLVDPETGQNLVNVSYAFARKNAGEAQSTGLELEARGQLTDRLSFHIGGAWVPDAEVQSQAVSRINPQAVQRVNVKEGNRMQITPVYSGSASLMYDFELLGYDALLRGDLSFTDTLFRSTNNERPSPTWELLNVKLLLSRDEYEYGFYINNIFDHPAPFGIGDSGYHGFHNPRTFGVQFNYNL